jgi:hypothetical protein
MDKWIRRWTVPSASGGRPHTVAMDKEGNFGCDCLAWTRNTPRKDCKHIKGVKGGDYEQASASKAEYVLAMVQKPKYNEKTNQLFIPLLILPDTRLMEATIVYYMLKHGYTMQEIREIRHGIPKEWTKNAVIDHVETHGEAEYPPPPKRYFTEISAPKTKKKAPKKKSAAYLGKAR